MADSVRVRRVADQIRAEVSQILRDEVRDPRVRMVTVTRVKVAPDLGSAVLFYSPLGEDPSAERASELDRAMRAAAGFVRRLLSKRVDLRHTPELRFVLDDSIAQGAETLELIRSLGITPDDASEGSSSGSKAEKVGEDGETQPES